MAADTPQLEFFGPGVEVRLTGHDPRCHLEVLVDTRVHRGTDAVRLEVLFQPRDERGLPRGAPAVLYASQWTLRPLASDTGSVAEGWLPRALTTELAHRCYCRVAPIILDAAEDEIPPN